MADALGNNANYDMDSFPIDLGKYTTVAGEFENSASAYGTYDQHLRPMYWDTAAPREGFRYVDQWGPEHEADRAIALGAYAFAQRALSEDSMCVPANARRPIMR